jgi:glutathione synthase/RimK-type ligase-like ATP-grasp enzyme
MTRVFINTYSYKSKSARTIRKGLGLTTFLKQRQEESRVTLRPSDIVINWGSASFWGTNCEIWNDPSKINIIGNKLLFMQKAHGGRPGFRVPVWTTDPLVAADWNQSVARTTLRGTRGDGIVITQKGTEPPVASLYTRYIKKNEEWRVHVAFNEVIDATRKIRDPNREVTDWQVRSLRNGFIFARESGEPPQQVKDAAIAAVAHFGLQFGGVDIITTKKGTPVVLEINSAPALIGTTGERYVNAFLQKLQTD